MAKTSLPLLTLMLFSAFFSIASASGEKEGNPLSSLKNCPLESIQGKTPRAGAVLDFYRQEEIYRRADEFAKNQQKNLISTERFINMQRRDPKEEHNLKDFDEIVDNAKKDSQEAMGVRSREKAKLDRLKAKAVDLGGLDKNGKINPAVGHEFIPCTAANARPSKSSMKDSPRPRSKDHERYLRSLVDPIYEEAPLPELQERAFQKEFSLENQAWMKAHPDQKMRPEILRSISEKTYRKIYNASGDDASPTILRDP